MELYTHEGDDNNKDHDTRLDVRIENRKNSVSRKDLAVGQDLFPGDEFRDDGDIKDRYRFFEWLTSALPSDAIQLADIVLPMVTIRISPNGYDTWKFDYQISFEFTSPGTEKPHIYSWQRKGVILDQDNTVHVGIYQGRPFPTATPPTAPLLTQVADDARLRSKLISVEWLQEAEVDEFIKGGRSVGIGLPALFQFHLGSARRATTIRCPRVTRTFNRLSTETMEPHAMSARSVPSRNNRAWGWQG